MTRYSVAVVGTGPDPAEPTTAGYAMGYRHAEAFGDHERCEVVACADVVPEHAAAFAAEFDVADANVYEDAATMAADVEPDVATVAVPPAVHEEVVVDLAETGSVRAIHCEKPMADALAGARRMVEACEERGIQLTFNRQRRFAKPFSEAKRLLDDGEIGSLERIEIGWGDLFDTGAHAVDLAGMYNDDRPAEWVIAQVDYREEDRRFGMHQENQAWAQWRYENGVSGVLSTGPGDDFVDCAIAIRGTDGTIRIDVEDGPMLEVESAGVPPSDARPGSGDERSESAGERRAVDVGSENVHVAPDEMGEFTGGYESRVADEVLEALRTGSESQLRGEIGLQTAEILFGAYESVRRRGRVDLPAEIDDHPLAAMVEAGDLEPDPAGDD